MEKTINDELKKVNGWLISNKLSLNVGKSCFLKFSLLPKNDINIKIASSTLEQKRVTKYLGVLIDDKLSWKDHIQSINIKLRKGIGILSNIKDYVTQPTLKSLYYSFIHHYLNYNLINWSTAQSSNMDCLRLSCKKAVRTILSKNKREHALPLFKILNILPLDELIKLKRGEYMWKIKNNLLPKSLNSWFHTNNSDIVNRINTNITSGINIKKYHLPNPRLEYAKRHITYSGVKLWNNEIPIELKTSTSSKCSNNKIDTASKTNLQN